MSSSPTFKLFFFPLVLVLSLTITACAGSRGEILEYTDRSDILEGPGLLTGEDGAFTLSFGGGESDGAAAEPSESESSDVSYQEFKAFKRSRETDQQDSGTLDDETLSGEYEEFQQWRKSQEYQDWKRNQGEMQ